VRVGTFRLLRRLAFDQVTKRELSVFQRSKRAITGSVEMIPPQLSSECLNQATEAALDAAQAVLTTSDSIREAIGESRQGGVLLDQISRFAREAPLRSLAMPS
jgi:hypothetical protein